MSAKLYSVDTAYSDRSISIAAGTPPPRAMVARSMEATYPRDRVGLHSGDYPALPPTSPWPRSVYPHWETPSQLQCRHTVRYW